MPYINIKTTKKLLFEDKVNIKSELGKAICIFPGKSENWLMCSVSDEENIWFKGDDSADSVFMEVKLFGSVDKTAANAFTEEISRYLKNTFSIEPSRIYIRYEGGTDWGWNGSNF